MTCQASLPQILETRLVQVGLPSICARIMFRSCGFRLVPGQLAELAAVSCVHVGATVHSALGVVSAPGTRCAPPSTAAQLLQSASARACTPLGGCYDAMSSMRVCCSGVEGEHCGGGDAHGCAGGSGSGAEPGVKVQGLCLPPAPAQLQPLLRGAGLAALPATPAELGA